MARNIKFEDIREGDTINVVTVVRTVVEAFRDGYIIGEGNIVYRNESALPRSERRFQLVERPTPTLPTEVGSVIKVNGVVWLLKQVYPGPEIWVPSRTGYADSSSKALAHYIRDSHNGEFEVIA